MPALFLLTCCLSYNVFGHRWGWPGRDQPRYRHGKCPTWQAEHGGKQECSPTQELEAPGDGGTYSLRFSMEQIEIRDQSGLTAMDVWSSHPKRTNYQASLGKENWVEC